MVKLHFLLLSMKKDQNKWSNILLPARCIDIKKVFFDNVTLVGNLGNTVVQATLNETPVKKCFIIKEDCDINPSFRTTPLCSFQKELSHC